MSQSVTGSGQRGPAAQARAGCRALLGTHSAGRLVFTHGVAHVRPVRYWMDGDSLLIRVR